MDLVPLHSKNEMVRLLNTPEAIPTGKSGRVLQVFLNQDLRNGHEGLAKTAKECGIDVSKLIPGQFVVFINAERNRLKLFAAFNVIAYLKLPGGKLDLNAIRYIPKAFNASGRMDYDDALKYAVTEALSKRRRLSHDIKEKIEK